MFTILKMIRKSTDNADHPAVAMLGIKAADRILVAGAGRPDLAGALGAVTRLNGQTTVVDTNADAGARVTEAATRAGGLVEWVTAPLAMLPMDGQTFDVVVLPVGLAALGAHAPLVLGEAIRVVRPGGRVAVCEPLPRQGLFRLAQRTPLTSPRDVIARLTAAGLRAARHLGDLDGTAYFEAARAR